LDLFVRSGSDQATRERVFQDWYRRELRSRAAPLMATWAHAFGVDLPQWGIKRMKTKWGTCSIEAKRVWLNLELVKKPPQCLEYVIVHELVHFFERTHSDRFVALLEQKLPQWRMIRDELNAAPLAHEEWSE
jgi:predicted metal-dependent hydrolase